MIAQIDRDYGFDENDIIESNESFEVAMKEIENRDILNKAATKLELLAQAIRDENKELFDELTCDADGAYCQGVGIVADVDLDEVRTIIFSKE